MDLFLYGCPRVLRYLSLSNQNVILYHLDKILKDLDLTFKEFKEICVVSGTDYNSENSLNLYKILDYFKEYKEFRKLKTGLYNSNIMGSKNRGETKSLFYKFRIKALSDQLSEKRIIIL